LYHIFILPGLEVGILSITWLNRVD